MVHPQPGILRWLRIGLIALMIALLMVFLPSGTIYSFAEIVPLPIDETGGVPPYDWGYLTEEEGYEDESISVRIEHGRFEGTNWTAVHVKIAHPSQLRTLKAGRYGSNQELAGAVMARRVKSVVAIGGDFFAFHGHGYIVRQGKFHRNRPTGKHDVLVIDDQGDFHLLIRPTKQDIEAYEKENKEHIINAFTFGPALIDQGKIIEDMTWAKTDPVLAQRIAFCQTGPLSYLAVYCEGPNDEGSIGMGIPQFARLVASFPGVISAYNLDGGSSATIVFKDKKINGPRAHRSRPIGDIIFFASAFVQDADGE
ncbi:MAG: phosphodiester glycosidase family protein [Christensenellales bacterium]|jgi:exopolysaccharide biosynthesis protein